MRLSRLLRFILAPFLAGFAYVDEPGAAADPLPVDPPADPPADPATDAGQQGAAEGGEATKPLTTLDAINQALADVSGAVTPNAAAPAAQPAADAGTAAAQAAAAPGTDPAKPAGPTDDELTAPLEGLKGRTKERFEQLAGRLKERSQEIETLTARLGELEQQAQAMPQAQEAVQTLSEIYGAMNEAQVSGEEFAGFLTYARQVRGGDFKAAAQTLIAQLKPLLPYVHGEIDLGGALDPLADYPDLQDAVAQHQITQQHAAELAQGRRIRQQTLQATQHATQQRTQTARQAAEAQQARDHGIAQIQGLERQLATSDPDYNRIAPELVKAIPSITKTYPPHLWAAAVRDRYDLLKSQAQRAPAPAAASARPAPIRPSGASGGVPSKLTTTDIVQMVAAGELT